MHRALRIAVILLAILATLGVSLAADSATHFHAKSPANSCDICITAHVSAGPADSLVSLFQAPQTRSHLVAGEPATGYSSLQGETSLTRGPPSHSL